MARTELGEALRLMEEGIASATGERFFRLTVRRLADVLGARIAFISEVAPEAAGRLRIIALWDGRDYGPPIEYALEGTPCQHVFTRGLAFFPERVQELFPKDGWLRSADAESYLAVALVSANGVPIGHLGVVHDQPLDDVSLRSDVLRTFAARAAAELERTRLERRLKESEERYRRLVEASPDAIYRVRLHPQFKFEYMNPATERILGYPLEQLLAADRDFFLSILIEEEDRPDLDDVLTGKTFYRAHVRHWRRGDGASVWTEQHNLPIYDEAGRLVAMEAVARDVTEREEALRALQAREEVQRRFLQALPDLLLRLDQEGRFLELIPTSGAQSPEELVGKRIEELLPSGSSRAALEAVKRAVASGATQSVRYSVELDDEDRHYEIRFVPMTSGNLLALLRDVTGEEWAANEQGRRRARDELESRVEREIGIRNPYQLTFREFTVLHLVAQGTTDKEIARQLGVSLSTVNKHVSNILGKIGAGSRTEASVRAVREGLVSL